MRKSIRSRAQPPVTQVTPAKKGSKRSQSQSAVAVHNDENVYDKGDYVAFIDASDSLEKYKIAQVSPIY